LKNNLRACGRSCIARSRIRKAAKLYRQAKDLDELVDLWNSQHVAGLVSREGDVIYITYPGCYCGQVNTSKQPMPHSYCECSCGWAEAPFEGVLGRTVSAELLESVQHGDSRCRLAVDLSEVSLETP